MSPSSREINGPRPAPLKIHSDSHLIHKPSSSSATNHHQQRHQPVIIYTHSPKVIHTQARDFMALVQKLTGLSHDTEDQTHPPQPTLAAASEDAGVGDTQVGCASSPEAPPMSLMGFDLLPPNTFMSPLLTPNSSDCFCSPNSFYRYSESSSLLSPVNPNVGSSWFFEA